MPSYFAGLDWASRTHAVCVIDPQGGVADRFEVEHDAAGLAALRRRLERFAGDGPVPVAIERPSGLIVDALVEAGHPVFPIHPNAVKAMRPRYRSHGAKSDASDASFLAQHRYCGRRPTAELLERLRAAPQGLAAELEADAKGEITRSLASVLERLVQQIASITARIEHEVAQLDDGRVLMSFPRAGRVCAAQILAELGNVRERFPTDSLLAAEAGVAPLTYESGNNRAVTFRWACNHRLRGALTCFADNSRHESPWAARLYANARGRGCDHPHAIRVLSRAWLRVLWRAWTDCKPYDPTLHGALQSMLAAPTG